MKKISFFFLRILQILPDPISRYIFFIIMFPVAFYFFRYKNKIKVIGIRNLLRRINILYIVGPHRCYIDSLPIRYFLMSIWELFFCQKNMPFDAPDKNNFYSSENEAYLMKISKNIPVERGVKDLAEEIVQNFCEILRHFNLILFPEGGRTKIGHEEMQEFKTGVAKTILYMTLNEPNFKVVPIYVGEVMSEIMPREIGQNYFKLKTGKSGYIVFGEPVDFSKICCNPEITDNEKILLIKEKGREAILSLKDQIPCK